MELIKAILFALIIGLSFTSSGCYVDDYGASSEVTYRSGVGYGYYHSNIWYAAPPGYVYVRGSHPYWGPRYVPAPRPYYRPAPFYRGGYGYGHSGFHGGRR